MGTALASVLPASEPLDIRWFRAGDRAACQRIAGRAAMSSYGAHMPSLRHVFHETTPLEPAEVRLVATVGGEPAGFIELVGGHVSNLFVDPAHQGQGIGAALMRRAEEMAPGELTLSVFTVNTGARRLYERLGFAVEGVAQTTFHGSVAEVWRMRKNRRARARRRRYDLVILDFYGVLADSAPWMVTNLGAVCRSHGLKPIDEAELARLRGLSNREIIQAMAVPFWKLPAIARDMRGRVAADAETIPLFAGSADFLAQLRAAEVRVAVVSSNAESTVRTILGEENAALVESFTCGAGLFGKAPLFRRVQRSAGVTGARVLCVGDETRDVEAARKAGFASAAVTWGYARPPALEASGPAHMAGSFEELLNIILG